MGGHYLKNTIYRLGLLVYKTLPSLPVDSLAVTLIVNQNRMHSKVRTHDTIS